MKPLRISPRLRFGVLLLLVVALGMAVLPAQAAVQTFDVDRTDDDAAATACTVAANDCSLRGAIITANTNGNPIDTDIINIPAGTYTLSVAGTAEDAAATGDLDITQSVSLVGAGADTTIIDANGIDRVFHVDPGAAGITVNIDDVTITGGDSGGLRGGGIYSGTGTLNVTNSIVTANTDAAFAAGIYNTLSGTMTITSSTISNNTGGSVGGIWNQSGTLNIIDSTLTGNSVTSQVGGVATSDGSQTTITNSTIMSNSAGNTGGGAYVENSGIVTIINSTISNNTSSNGGGGLWSQGTGSINITNSTIANNTATAAGGGIYVSSGTVTVDNSIVANNTAPSGPDVFGTIDSASYSLFSDTTDLVFTNPPATDTLLNVDPGLLPLMDHGGPTLTHAFRTSSPVVDAGSCTGTDQRGIARPFDVSGKTNVDNGCDMGAFELEVFTAFFNVTKEMDTNDGTCNADCSLREAITAANTNGNAGSTDIILIPAGTYILDVPTSGFDDNNVAGDLDILQNVSISGAGPSLTIVDASAGDRVFNIKPPAGAFISVNMSNLTMTNGDTGGGPGGGIAVGRAEANLTNVVITGSAAGTAGGLLVEFGATVTLTSSVVSGNNATTQSGGIQVQGGTSLYIIDSTISGNTATGSVAGIWNSGTLIVESSTISGNTTAGPAGGLVTHGGTTATIINSTFSGNSTARGGGIYNNGGALTIEDSTITSNSASDAGGGIYYASGTTTIENSIISDNTATANGPDIFGTIDTMSYSLVSDDADFLVTTSSENLLNISPSLEPLADNGGPTLTHALPITSPAVDAGSCTGTASDQRGLPRRVNFQAINDAFDACDMGAVERQDSPPTVVDDSYNTSFETQLLVDAATGVLVNDSDVDNQSLTAAVDTNPSNGTLSLSADGSFTYTPNALFGGVDTFTYNVSDGVNTAMGTVTVTVDNPVPVAVDDAYSATTADPLVTTTANGLLANDTDANTNDTLTAVLDTGPTNGVLNLNPDGTFTYTPNPDFIGVETLTYHANDGTSDSNVATVSITVTNSVPVAANDIYTAAGDNTLSIPAPGVLGNDNDANLETLIPMKVSNPSNGTVVLNADGSFVYTPHASFVGTDVFNYTVNDGTANSNVAAVSITVQDPSTCGIGTSTSPPIRPVLTWMRSASENADWYNLILYNATTGGLAFAEWFPGSFVCTGQNCMLQTTADLLPYGLLDGDHQLWIQTYTNTTLSGYSQVATLTVDLPTPASPSGLTVTTVQGRPQITWPQDDNALYYQVFVGTQTTLDLVHLQWYEKTASVCCGGTCTLNLDVYPETGDYTIYLQAWGPGGFNNNNSNDWAGPFNFSVNFQRPVAVSGMTATAANGMVDLSWTGVDNANQYNVWVGTVTPDDVETDFFDTLSAIDLGCPVPGQTCAFVPPVTLAPGAHSWYVQAQGPGGTATGGVVDGWAEGPTFFP